MFPEPEPCNKLEVYDMCNENRKTWIIKLCHYILTLAPWFSGYHYCTTSFKSELNFCKGLNIAYDVWEIRKDEDI